jgi:TPR repeat protein
MAESGDPKAQHLVGLMYEDGWYCEKNKKLAIEWYKRAATNGNGSASDSYIVALNLEWSSEEGGVADEESLFWLTLAAKQGHPFAQAKLALHYSKASDPDKKYLACAWRNMVGDYDRIKIDHLLVKELRPIENQFTDKVNESASSVTNLLRQAVVNKLWKQEILRGSCTTNHHAFEWTFEYLSKPGILVPASPPTS